MASIFVLRIVLPSIWQEKQGLNESLGLRVDRPCALPLRTVDGRSAQRYQQFGYTRCAALRTACGCGLSFDRRGFAWDLPGNCSVVAGVAASDYLADLAIAMQIASATKGSHFQSASICGMNLQTNKRHQKRPGQLLLEETDCRACMPPKVRFSLPQLDGKAKVRLEATDETTLRA